MTDSIIQTLGNCPDPAVSIQPPVIQKTTEIEFRTGMCLEIQGKKYRCLNVTPSYLILCEMDCTRLNLTFISPTSAQRYLLNGTGQIIQDFIPVLDIMSIKEKFQNEFYYRRDVMTRIVNHYGPDFLDLNGKKPKPFLEEILSTEKITRKLLHKLLIRYLQSGMADYALVDKRWVRYFNRNNDKDEKPKPKSDMHIHFDWGIDYIKSKKGKASVMDAYLKMSWEFYSQTISDDKKIKRVLLPADQRPTYKQFLYYYNKVVSAKEKEIIKTSQAEYRNNKRLFTGSSSTGVYGAYDMLEMDACEIDLALVNEHNNTVGSPVVYVLIDVATRALTAVSASFENNSVTGFMSCLCNLNEDKRTLLVSHGIDDYDPKAWLTGYRPRAIRMDNGADFRSNRVGEVLRSFGIERVLVSPRSGSLKGVVERSFRDFQEKIRPSTADFGYRSKGYGSDHNREATLTMHDFKAMLYNWVLCHNTIVNEGLELSRDMIRQKIAPIPCEVMDYMINAKKPLRFPVGDEFLTKILSKGTANITRSGIEFHKLIYFPENDQSLIDMIERLCVMDNSSIHILYDEQCIDRVFYVSSGRLTEIPLNLKSGLQYTYAGMTFKEVDDMFEDMKEIMEQSKERTQQARAKLLAKNDSIVEKAIQEKYANSKDIRKNRAEEKQRINKKDALSKRFRSEGAKQPETPALPEPIKSLSDSVTKTETTNKPNKKLTLEEKIKRIGELANEFYED